VERYTQRLKVTVRVLAGWRQGNAGIGWRMFDITVEIEKVACRDTESIHSSDKFAMSGAFVGDAGAVGVYLPSFRINDNEQRRIDRSYRFSSTTPRFAMSLMAWDLDENDSWTDNEDSIKTGVDAIAIAASVVWSPAAGEAVKAVGGAVIGIVDQFNEWDHDDKLLDFNEVIELPWGDFNVEQYVGKSIPFSHDDGVGLSSWDYTLELRIRYTQYINFPDNPPPAHDGKFVMEAFRQRATAASDMGFVGGYPTFYFRREGREQLAGALLFREGAAKWDDVPLVQFGNPRLDDFGQRMRGAQDYAVRAGFVGAFPNFFDTDNGFGPVAGTIFLPAVTAEWRDLAWTDIGNPDLDDFVGRFRGVNDWAVRNGFLGGFPNMYHADHPNGRVGGSILIKPSQADVRWVHLYDWP
jgi:hypothetical protein